MLTSREEYFKKVTHSPASGHLKDVELLKASILTSLQDNKSSLANFLSSLSRGRKSSLIKALILNDSKEIIKILLDPIKAIYPDVKPEILQHLAELSPNDNKNALLNPAVLLIIRFMLKDFSNLLQALIIQNAMQLIPDTQMDFQTKLGLVVSIDKEIADRMLDLAHNPQLLKLQNNCYEGNISINEYYQIGKSQLDYSEFIVCTLGVLQHIIVDHPKAAKDIMNIYKLYDKLEYQSAINEIKAFCHKYPIDKNLKTFIIEKSNQCTLPTGRNYTRRFYENRRVQLESKTIDLDKLNKVSVAITGVSIHSLDEIKDVVTSYAVVKLTKELNRRMYEIRSNTRFNRPRVQKVGVFSTEEEFNGQVGELIWTQNPGVMVSNQPNFRSETTEVSLRNRVTDIRVLPDPVSLSDKQHLGAYVSSISGHAFVVLVLLEKYMKEHRNDPSLESDINNYLKVLIMGYVDNAYHGNDEMIAVFTEISILSIFERFRVNLNLDSSPEVMRQSMLDTQEYAKMLCLKKTINNQLHSVFQTNPRYEPEPCVIKSRL